MGIKRPRGTGGALERTKAGAAAPSASHLSLRKGSGAAWVLRRELISKAGQVLQGSEQEHS